MKKILIITAIVIVAGMFIGCGSQESVEWFLDESKITVKVDPCFDDSEPEEPAGGCKILGPNYVLGPNFRCVPLEIGITTPPEFKMTEATGTKGDPVGGGVPMRTNDPVGGGAPMKLFTTAEDGCVNISIYGEAESMNANGTGIVNLDGEEYYFTSGLEGDIEFNLKAYTSTSELTIGVVDELLGSIAASAKIIF